MVPRLLLSCAGMAATTWRSIAAIAAPARPPLPYTKVFGIGLNKTGTTTLGRCLSRLGFSHESCRHDLLDCYRAGDLDSIFKNIDQFDAFEDWPYPLMYRELFDRFGDRARYVLTTRSSPERWLNSLKSHSLRTPPDRHCRRAAYGYDYPHGRESEHLAFYEQHNQSVRDFFRERSAEHLLLEVCWETGDDWTRLCAFLGFPVPRKPFPHANKGGDVDVDPKIVSQNQANVSRQLASIQQDLLRH
jgi:hypothetical protein